jgi:hypothetical protein
MLIVGLANKANWLNNLFLVYLTVSRLLNVARLGCRNWTIVARNQEGWKELLKETEAHPGLQGRWREREILLNILRINCAPSWLYLQDYTGIHHQQNVKSRMWVFENRVLWRVLG